MTDAITPEFPSDQQLLSPNQALAHVDAVRAADRAGGTVAAPHAADFFGQPREIVVRLRPVAADLRGGGSGNSIGQPQKMVQ